MALSARHRRASLQGVDHFSDVRIQRSTRCPRGSVQSLRGISKRRSAAIRTVLRLGRKRVRLSGTRAGNTIELESQPNQNQVVKITVTLSASGESAQGTYTITGGCGGRRSGPIDGRLVNLTGVWGGMMGSIPARLDILMATTPDADGNFGVSGTATFLGTSCFPNAVIQRRGGGRIVFPDIDSPPNHVQLIEEVWEDLSAMKVSFAITQSAFQKWVIGFRKFQQMSEHASIRTPSWTHARRSYRMLRRRN